MNDTPTDQQNAARLAVFQQDNPYEPPWLLVVAALVCSLYLLAPNAADADLWGHVRYGWDSLSTGALPSTTTYSYLAEGHRWVNHETVAEWVMGAAGHYGGGSGLMVMKVVLAAWTLGLLHLIIRRRTMDSLASCILLVGGAWAMRYYWGTRPQLFSFACFSTLLFLLDQSFARWFSYRDSKVRDSLPMIDWLPLAATPLVIALWTNSHGGFIAGLAVLVLTLVGRSVQQWIWQCRLFPESSWKSGMTGTIGMAIVAGLACLATLATPYGTELLSWIRGSLGVSRPEILEWGPWDLSPAGQRLLWFTVPLAATFWISRKPKDWVEIALLVLLTWQSFKHMRHSPFLVMALMAWGAPHLRNSCRWLQSTLTRALPASVTQPAATETELPTHRWVRGSRLTPIAAGAMALWFSVLLVQQCREIRVFHDRYPVDAFRFMKQHQLEGRLMVAFNWAQYAIDALCEPASPWHENRDVIPEQQVTLAGVDPNSVRPATAGTSKRVHQPTLIAIDGRFRTAYAQSWIDWHFDFLMGDTRPRVRNAESGPVQPEKILELGQPDLVLLERRYPTSVNTIRQQQDQWVLLYQDPIAELWGRRNRFDQPESADWFPPEERVTIPERANVWSPWPAR